jgi:hypothetical protein
MLDARHVEVAVRRVADQQFVHAAKMAARKRLLKSGTTVARSVM